MSRISIIIILGVGAAIMIGIMGVLATILGRSYFMITDRDTQLITPIALVVETAVVESTQTATPEPTASTTATITPTAPSSSATNIAVQNTSVQYVMAKTNVNIRSGPSTDYDIIGWVANGQTAKVTGVSNDNSWWRVICPDNATGSCWVIASSQYTQPTDGVSAGCTDAATFVADVTIPDGSQILPGTSLEKVWRIKNSGTCTWDNRYKLIFAGNNPLGTLANSFALKRTVAPNELVDLDVVLIAPTSPGTYQSDWKLQNAQGEAFGIGANHNKPFWVKIVVSATPTAHRGSISGFVWQDKDNDNIVDGNEMLPNITVTLATGGECRTVISSMKTDGNGRFTFANLAPNTYCLLGTDGTTTVSQANIVLGQDQQLTGINLTWPPVWPQPTTISGLIYQDANQNGIYNYGETLMGSRPVWLIPGTTCHVQKQPQAMTFSDANGRFTLAGEFNGSYCVGLVNDSNQLDDVMSITVTSGQTMNNINLKYPAATGSISGYLWNDYCLTNEAGDALAGDCILDGNGYYRADGMIQPSETNIPDITILLQQGSCNTDNPVAVPAVTDSTGKYSFNNLQAGTYCVFMNAASPQNGSKLLPGDWTFPARGIWYHQLTLQTGENAYSVNFGWDYQLQ